jgi:hypothetical protein
MRIEATPEVRSYVSERGGMLFVRTRQVLLRGPKLLETTTEPPPDALDWRRIESRGLLVFVPEGMRLPKTLVLCLSGRFRRRVRALWNGCAYVI